MSQFCLFHLDFHHGGGVEAGLHPLRVETPAADGQLWILREALEWLDVFPTCSTAVWCVWDTKVFVFLAGMGSSPEHAGVSISNPHTHMLTVSWSAPSRFLCMRAKERWFLLTLNQEFSSAGGPATAAAGGH